MMDKTSALKGEVDGDDEQVRNERKSDLKIFEYHMRGKLVHSIKVGQRYELILIGLVLFMMITLYMTIMTNSAISKPMLLTSFASCVSFFLLGMYQRIQKPKTLLNQMNKILRVFHVRFNFSKMKLVRLKLKQNVAFDHQHIPSVDAISTSFRESQGIPGLKRVRKVQFPPTS